MGTIIEISATVIDILFLIWFVPKFNGVSLNKKPYALIIAALLLMFQLYSDKYLDNADLLSVVMQVTFAIAFSITISNRKIIWSVFSAILYVIVIMLSSTLAFTIFSLFAENFADVIQGEMSNIRLIYLLVCKTFHMSFYRLLLTVFKKDKSMDLKNGILSFVFTAITAFALGILLELTWSFEFEEKGFLVTVLAISLIVLNIMLYVMVRQVQNLLKNKYELKLIQERIDFERARVEEATAVWEKIRRIKHDLKNHFVVLNGKLEEGNICACQEYLYDLTQNVESMDSLIQSGNSVIDYLINSKLANLDDVQIIVSGYVGNYSDINDVDLACIIGNIIDNAVEAQDKVVKDKRIELHFLQKNTNRIIICKNAICESVLKNNHTLKSTKSSSDFHGLGHQIVETTLHKYNGLVTYFEEEGMFGVQLMIPMLKDE